MKYTVLKVTGMIVVGLSGALLVSHFILAILPWIIGWSLVDMAYDCKLK